MSLAGDTLQTLKEDRYRLLGLSVIVPTDDQLERAREKAGPDLPARARIMIELEPLSYRLDTDDGSEIEQVERGYIDVTKSRAGLTASDLVAVREQGWFGVPGEKRLTLPRNLAKRNPDSLNTPYQRFMRYAGEADVDVLVQGSDDGVPAEIPSGQFWTPSVGKVYAVKHGFDDFPAGDGSYSRYVYYLMEEDATFVADPLNERDVRVVKRSLAEGGEKDAVTTSQNTGPSTEQLRAAAEKVGIVGGNVSDFESAAQQVSVTMRGVELGAPILGAGEVAEAASEGRLLEYLAEAGAIGIADDGTIN